MAGTYDIKKVLGEGDPAGNCIHSENDERLPLWITGGNTLVTGSLFENVTLTINNKTGKSLPIVVNKNILHHSELDHRSGNLIVSD
jgi:hypothetical protein